MIDKIIIPDIGSVKDEVDEILYNFQEVKITNADEYTNAGDVLKQVQMKLKRIDEKRKEYTQPMDQAKKRIMDDFKQVTQPLEEFIATVKGKMLDWYREEQKRLKEEQDRIDREALARAKKKNIDQVEVPVVTNQNKTQYGNIATVTVRKVWTYKVTNPEQVPREYLILDEKKIKEEIKTGKRVIPGLKIYQEEQAPTIR